MRLLHTLSHKLEEFLGDNIPTYAILSHTWGLEEVLYQDMVNGTATSKKGWKKVFGCCSKAYASGLEWVWIDTCCIDKSSSAELSEAINSMFSWYNKSHLCYAYLEDVRTAEWVSGTSQSPKKVYSFLESRWFTRGWTLQELIAPEFVEFYDSEWVEIGTKDNLAAWISSRTFISKDVLRGERWHRDCTAAEKMLWASKRNTTRVEDQAYCLLGIFDVNMPLLYGEGRQAFIRLQNEILKREEDTSLLAWTLPAGHHSSTGVLASSPANFANPSQIFRYNDGTTRAQQDPMSMTRKCGFSPSNTLISEGSFYQQLKGKPFPLDSKQPRPSDLTGRGLRISLPLRKAKAPISCNLAYLGYEYQGWLVCIHFRQMFLNCRELHALILIQESLLSEFSIEGIYFYTSGEVFFKPAALPSVRGEVQVMLDKEASTLDMYPPCSNEDLSFDFGEATQNQGLGMIVGIVACLYEEKNKSIVFLVGCGFFSGSPWCAILFEIPKARCRPEIVRKLDQQLRAESRDTFSDTFSEFSDTAMKQSDNLANVFIQAKMRKKPSPAAQDQVYYTLRIEISQWVSFKPWMLFCLPPLVDNSKTESSLSSRIISAMEEWSNQPSVANTSVPRERRLSDA